MEQEQNLPQRWSVGSMVRAPFGEQHHRRAVIATLYEQDETAEVLYDAPSCLQLQSSFLVDSDSKQMQERNAVTDEEEITAVVNLQNLKPLHPWENESLDAIHAEAATILGVPATQWKERGDMLLQQVRDPLSAALCYQKALRLTCGPNSQQKMQLTGSTILLIEGGHCVAAEVDCQEEDDDDRYRLDVTLLATGDEKTIPIAAARLVVQLSKDRFQERTLLNLARCCLQLAKVPDSSSHQQKSAFLRHTVLGCTLALAVHEVHCYNGDASTTNKTVVTALLLRSHAQEQRGKLQHAKVDVQRVIRLQKDHPEAQRSLQRLQKRQLSQARGNRKLARDVSQWVQTAVSCSSGTGTGRDDETKMDGPVDSSCSQLPDESQQQSGGRKQQQQGREMVVLLFSITVVFLAMYFNRV